MGRVTPFLMFNDQLEAAIAFYTATFPDSEVRVLAQTGAEGPVRAAVVAEGVSLSVDCADQAEVDALWAKFLQAGATPSQCGWIKDPFGLSWQIVPRRFTELIQDPDPKKVKAVMDAMLKMVKLDVAELERAHREA